MALNKKYRCMNVGNCNHANENKTFEIPEGADLICPECKKDMLVEVKSGPNIGKIVICAVGAAALIGGGVFLFGGFGSDTDNAAVADTAVTTEVVTEVVETPVDTLDEVVAETPVDTVTAPVEEKAKDVDEKEKQPKPVNYLTGYSLGYGTYTGPAKNGRPHGPNGEINVTSTKEIDLADGGKTVTLNRGDKVIQTKFVDGKLVQGLIVRPDNSRKTFRVGV